MHLKCFPELFSCFMSVKVNAVDENTNEKNLDGTSFEGALTMTPVYSLKALELWSSYEKSPGLWNSKII